MVKMDKISRLNRLLDKENQEALLIFDDSYSNQNIFYLTNFLAPDPFIFYKKRGEEPKIVLPRMEVKRAEERTDFEVIALDDFVGENDYIKAIKKLSENINNLAVPCDFPLKYAKEIDVSLDVLNVSRIRRKKSEDEIEKILKAQRVAEKGIKKAIELFEKSVVRNGKVFYRGERLTSEKVKFVIEKELLKNRASCEDIIVSSGKNSSNPHESGHGYLSPSPIVIDVFPRLKDERYCGDMTRTFSLTKNDLVKEIYQDVLKAQKIALKNIRSGKSGSRIHKQVEKYFKQNGYGISGDEADINYLHSTGHGVGLDVHESPSISEKEDELEKGDVVTVEPGLYGQDFGGVRIEDLVVVKEKGIKNLNSLEKQLYIS